MTNTEEKKVILIVDDAPANIQVAHAILKDTYKTRVATSGKHQQGIADEGIEGQLAAGRHARAFDLIVPEFRNRVFRLAFSILKDRAAAEDAAQETFVRVWKALPGFDGRAALATWICRRSVSPARIPPASASIVSNTRDLTLTRR